MAADPEVMNKHSRKKRFILGSVALVFVDEKFNEASEKINGLKTQVNSRLKLLTAQTNIRFSETESGLKSLAKVITDQAQLSRITDQRLSSLILQTFTQNKLITERLALLDQRVSKNEEMILNAYGILTDSLQNLEAMSLSCLSVDEVVLQTIQNATGVSIFDKTKSFLFKIRQGR